MAKQPTVLITGGAGYIGSHAILAFLEAAYKVVVLDNLSTGRRWAVPESVPLIVGDVGDRALLDRTLAAHDIGAVIHFAGSIVVPESIADPLAYYGNNTAVSRTLIAACVANRVRRFVFSSTAAVYGMGGEKPLAEGSPTEPINPYGTSKLVTEWILRDVAAAHDFAYVALRYFNVAGADPQGRTGQSTPRATHLIKRASEVATGRLDHIDIFGDDYDTRDGTCVRDYIHVTDLVAAHVAALAHLVDGGKSQVMNCGYGHGYTVREVLDAIQRETGERLDIRMAPRRAGDPASLVADSTLLRARFGWVPRHDDIDVIVGTAVAWERTLAARVSEESTAPA